MAMVLTWPEMHKHTHTYASIDVCVWHVYMAFGCGLWIGKLAGWLGLRSSPMALGFCDLANANAQAFKVELN